MNDYDKKITFRLDKPTIEALDAIVSAMNEKSEFHVSHTRSDALRYCVRFVLGGLRAEKNSPSTAP